MEEELAEAFGGELHGAVCEGGEAGVALLAGGCDKDLRLGRRQLAGLIHNNVCAGCADKRSTVDSCETAGLWGE